MDGSAGKLKAPKAKTLTLAAPIAALNAVDAPAKLPYGDGRLGLESSMGRVSSPLLDDASSSRTVTSVAYH